MSPVLLLAMGVVVLLVGPASGEADPLAAAVLVKSVVDELAADKSDYGPLIEIHREFIAPA